MVLIGFKRLFFLITLFANTSYSGEVKLLKETQFKFDNYAVKLSLLPISGQSSIIGVKAASGDTLNLELATPQFMQQPVTKVPAEILSDFNGLKTINTDIDSQGFDTVKIEEKKLKSGHLYRWETPTFGSAAYFYLQNPKVKTLAFKLGPFPGSVLVDFKIDWADVTWSNVAVD